MAINDTPEVFFGKTTRHVVLMSGGLDSLVLLARVHNRTMNNTDKTITPLFIKYGSKHNLRELDAAMLIADWYGTPLRILDLKQVFDDQEHVFMQSNPEALPQGNYRDEHMRTTYVPGRNIAFHAVAVAFAGRYLHHYSNGAAVWSAIQSGDDNTSPDCRIEYVMPMRQAVYRATRGKIRLSSPFVAMTKEEILEHGLDLKAPLELSRSCFRDTMIACGKCGNCQRRLEAFEAVGIADPIEYESREILKEGEVG